MTVVLTVDPGAPTFSGNVEMALVVSRPTSLIWVNAKELEIVSAELLVSGAASPVKATVHLAPPEHVGFEFPRPLPAGDAVLRVSYRGALSEERSSGLYVQRDGDEPLVYSQLESTHARRVFPCFDEPAFKIPWQLTLRVPRGLDAASNTPEVSRAPDGELDRIVFAPTPPLPSYLLAVVVGKLAFVDAGRAGRRDTPLRIIAPRGREREAAFAASIHGELLRRLEAYFDVPFPYEKLDNVGRPEGRGAMENAGLIISGGAILLADPASEAASFRLRTASTAAHEIAHQWFGDLVTMAWWDDLWLNEAFATWLEPRVFVVRPDWSPEAERGALRAKGLLHDLLPSARRIRQPIETRGDIDNAFDAITYEKGAAVLRMFEHHVGEETFRAGVKAYLEKHAHGNATTADFLAAIEGAHGTPLAADAGSFLDQPGFPELAVDVRCDGKPRVVLTQRRYVAVGRDAGDALWRVPVCLRGKGCQVLAQPTAELPLASCPKLLFATAGGAGYHVATYGDTQWSALVSSAHALTLEEQLAVITDARVGLTAGRLPAERALRLIERWNLRARPPLVHALVELARTLPERDLIAEEARLPFARWVMRVFGARARALGWKARPGERDEVRVLRPRLLALVALHGRDARLAAEARALADAWLADRAAVDPDALEGVLEVAAWTGDAAFAERLRGARGADAVERQLLVRTLLGFAAEDAFTRAAGLYLTDVHPRDFRYLRTTATDNPATRRMFRFVTQHHDALAARLPEDTRSSLLHAGRGLCSADDARAYDGFFRKRAAALHGGPRTFALVLEDIEMCAAAKSALAAGATSFLTR